MLTGADIIAAKLVVQLKLTTTEQVRLHLEVTDTDPETEVDFLSRLAWSRLINQKDYQRVRRYVAMFEYVRYEAIYLRQVERQGKAKDVVYDLIAKLEYARYRRPLSQILLERKQITPAEASTFEHRTLTLINREDLKVLDRYRKQKFEGVSRPLIPQDPITDNAFRVAVLFRSAHTLQKINVKIQGIQAEQEMSEALASVDPQTVTPADLADPIQAGADDERTRSAIFDRARFKARPRTSKQWRTQTIGPYSVIEQLGEGGIGTVFLAQKHGTGPIVALKVLRKSEAEPEDESRFEREARICAVLDHPNTIKLLDRGVTEDGTAYLVLPCVTGETLRDKIHAPGGLPAADAFRYLEQLCEGFDAIHDAHIVHRDLKPANVVIMAGVDEVKIVDFGLARFIERDRKFDQFRTVAGAISGSPAYVAPETVAGAPVDERADIYSLGVLWFEMLTSERPLQAPTAYAYLKEHLIGVPLCLRQVRPEKNWHPDLERLIAKMLAKHPDDRPQSCGEILEAVRGGLRMKALAALSTPPEARGELDLMNPYY